MKTYSISLHKGSVCLVQTMCMTNLMNPRNWACRRTVLFMRFADMIRYAYNCMTFTKLWRTFIIFAHRKSFVASRCRWNAAAFIMPLMKCPLQAFDGQNCIYIKIEDFSSSLYHFHFESENFHRNLTTDFLRKYSEFQVKMTIWWENIINNKHKHMDG